MKIGNADDFYVTRYCRHNKVTGSMYLYSVHFPNGQNTRFFFEAGSKQGEDDASSFNGFVPFNTQKMKFGIITHNHLDHVGLLPVVVRQGFRGRIYTSDVTASLLDITLYDSASIEDPLLGTTICNIDEVSRTLKQVSGCKLEKIIHPEKDITIAFYSNGHIIGAVLTLIVIMYPGKEPITILHTGDYKPQNIFFNVKMPPEKVREMGISNIVCESTYGDVDSTDPKFNKCLAQNTAEALRNGMTVLYPTFAQDRHQSTLFDIRTWKDTGIIPENTPVIVDGKSSQEYNARYKYQDLGIYKEMRNFMPKGVSCVPRSKSRTSFRNKIISNTEPQIILAPSGMGDYGPISSYLKAYISRDDALIHALGYCSPSSIMYRLLNTPRGEKVKYKGEYITVRCKVATTSEKTSHARRDELLKLIRSFPNTKSISINHGERLVQSKFRTYLLENLDLPEDQILTANSETGVRIESNGITELFQTSFEPIF